MQSLLVDLELYSHLLHVVQIQSHEVLFILLYIPLRGLSYRPLHALLYTSPTCQW